MIEAGSRLAFTTDALTVKPLFFRCGDIGKLAITGTVNDLAVMGAKPLYHSLERIVKSMTKTAQEAGVLIVAGDIKVIPSVKGEDLFIAVFGVGETVYEGLSCINI